jgi:ABC-type uncharacterized transport system permease subunit
VSRLRRAGSALVTANGAVVTLLALVLAAVVGGLLVAGTDPATRAASAYFFARPSTTIHDAFAAVGQAYAALFEGSILNPGTLSSHSATKILQPLSETVTVGTPLILAGLSVALAFRAGLFNIGAQGQLILGAIVGGWIGFGVHLPVVIHLIVAVVGAGIGGALWGGIVGLLKARTGAHEVITTIMLNYVALQLLNFLLSAPQLHGRESFQAPPYSQPTSRTVDSSALYPKLAGSGLRVNLGIAVALAAAVGVWWLLERSVLGFRIRAVGANPAAARTAGIDVARITVITLVLAGLLAGLAGASQVLGTNSAVTGDIDAGIGFDAITVALLGRSKPGGVVGAGLLFGALRAGGLYMQSATPVPVDLVTVLEALIVIFIAAPTLVIGLFRLRAARAESAVPALTQGWGQ